MKRTSLRKLTLAVVGCAFLSTQAIAQSAEFAAPKRIKAGDKFMGQGRMYPSPVFHDVDGDGLKDVVIGDLIGKVTVALQIPGEAIAFGREEPMLRSDGKPLKFHNW